MLGIDLRVDRWEEVEASLLMGGGRGVHLCIDGDDATTEVCISVLMGTMRPRVWCVVRLRCGSALADPNRRASRTHISRGHESLTQLGGQGDCVCVADHVCGIWHAICRV